MHFKIVHDLMMMAILLFAQFDAHILSLQLSCLMRSTNTLAAVMYSIRRGSTCFWFVQLMNFICEKCIFHLETSRIGIESIKNLRCVMEPRVGINDVEENVNDFWKVWCGPTKASFFSNQQKSMQVVANGVRNSLELPS